MGNKVSPEEAASIGLPTKQKVSAEEAASVGLPIKRSMEILGSRSTARPDVSKLEQQEPVAGRGQEALRIQAKMYGDPRYQQEDPKLANPVKAFAQGFTGNWADNIESVVRPGDYRENQFRDKQSMAQAVEENKIPYLAGAVMSPLPTGILGGAVSGGIQALGDSSALNEGNFADAADDAAGGILTGGLIGGGAKLIGNAARGIGKAIKPFADRSLEQLKASKLAQLLDDVASAEGRAGQKFGAVQSGVNAAERAREQTVDPLLRRQAEEFMQQRIAQDSLKRTAQNAMDGAAAAEQEAFAAQRALEQTKKMATPENAARLVEQDVAATAHPLMSAAAREAKNIANSSVLISGANRIVTDPKAAIKASRTLESLGEGVASMTDVLGKAGRAVELAPKQRTAKELAGYAMMTPNVNPEIRNLLQSIRESPNPDASMMSFRFLNPELNKYLLDLEDEESK